MSLKKAYKGYSSLEPGETVITKRKNASYYMIGRLIITIITLIMFVYAIYETEGWYWKMFYIMLSAYYLYYTYTRGRDWRSFNTHQHDEYFSSIDEDEFIFIKGNKYGRLEDFESIILK